LPYTNVAAEETFKFIHGPLELSLQIDRIDQLDEGGYVVLDYKTGQIPKNLQKEWSRAEPIANQLLTYSIAWQQQHPTVSPIHALVLAQIKPHQVKTAGLSIDDVGLPGVEIYKASEWSLAPQEVSLELMATEQVAPEHTANDCSAEQHSTKQDWQLALGGLQHKIMNIADAFITGDARNVSGSINDLKFCDIKALLRLHEIDQDSSDELDVELGGDHD
jgi:ATP-dependent helicase/nuclease subunit B